MTLTSELYQEIKNDLKNDFPDIKEIKQEDNNIIIKGNDDVLWDIFEVLYHGGRNIEFNASKDEEHYLIITI